MKKKLKYYELEHGKLYNIPLLTGKDYGWIYYVFRYEGHQSPPVGGDSFGSNLYLETSLRRILPDENTEEEYIYYGFYMNTNDNFVEITPEEIDYLLQEHKAKLL